MGPRLLYHKTGTFSYVTVGRIEVISKYVRVKGRKLSFLPFLSSG